MYPPEAIANSEARDTRLFKHHFSSIVWVLDFAYTFNRQNMNFMVYYFAC
jgi:hypothetical protein